MTSVSTKQSDGLANRSPLSFMRGGGRGLVIFLTIYATCLFILLPRLSLWLDEILDLKGIRHHDLPSLLGYVASNGGGVPLGYLAQAATIDTFGYSIFSARLPSVLFGLASCVGVFLLGRRIHLRRPLFGVLIFCAMPLGLRYALEARPYSQALALSVWATVFFFRLVDRPRAGHALIYTLIVSAGLYTQPYSVFVPCAHLLWLCGSRTRPNKRLLLSTVFGAILLSGLSFLPWYLHAHLFWNTAISPLPHTIGAGAALLIIKEITGAGYWGAVPLFFAVWLGFRKGSIDFDARLFWALSIAVPIALALVGDIFFGYFLAIRQMIFVLPPLALMAAKGIEALSYKYRRQTTKNDRLSHNRRFRAAVLCVLLAAFVGGDVLFFLRPRENWQSASRSLGKFAQNGSCIIFVPASSAEIYRFFDSRLPRHSCQRDLAMTPHVAVALSPYETAEERNRTLRTLTHDGFMRTRELNPQGPRIYLYAR